MEIKFDHIQVSSFVDGPGSRTVLFVAGCHFHCVGCQSSHLWTQKNAMSASPETIADTLIGIGDGYHNHSYTISGGDPLDQTEGISQLVSIIKERRPDAHIIVYTGYEWEELLTSRHADWSDTLRLLENINILVDGQFKKDLDNDLIMYRGSTNQRPIDVKESLDDYFNPHVLDWSKPALTVSQTGEITLPKGLADSFSEIGKVENNRMCGQSR